jgi:hypothetical protein
VRYYLIIVWLFISVSIHAQTGTIRQVRIPVEGDTISFHNTSVNPSLFEVYVQGLHLPDSLYTVDFIEANIILRKNAKKILTRTDTLYIKYLEILDTIKFLLKI